MPGRALQISVRVVQGLGFRPLVYRLARQLALSGRVFNTSGDVSIHLEGNDANLQDFVKLLRQNPPAAARIESITAGPVPFEGLSGFVNA